MAIGITSRKSIRMRTVDGDQIHVFLLMVCVLQTSKTNSVIIKLAFQSFRLSSCVRIYMGSHQHWNKYILPDQSCFLPDRRQSCCECCSAAVLVWFICVTLTSRRSASTKVLFFQNYKCISGLSSFLWPRFPLTHNKPVVGHASTVITRSRFGGLWLNGDLEDHMIWGHLLEGHEAIQES